MLPNPRLHLLSLPLELLERCAFELVCSTPLGPPSALIPLLLTCKSLYTALSSSRNKSLYATIFKYKFDTSAVRRRAFDPKPSEYCDQLRLYCTVLHSLRGQVGVDADDVLFGAFVMLLENDGRNEAQLAHAGLDAYLEVFVRTRMWNRRLYGWPTDNTAAACALWIVWMTTSEKKLSAESPARRNQMIKLVLPFVLLPFRYASAFAPLNHFVLPPSNAIHTQPFSITTAHGSYPIYLDPGRVRPQAYFSSRRALVPPLITTAAKMVYFSRRETVAFDIPHHLPLTREEAISLGRPQVSPTQADIHEVNAHLNQRLPEHREPEWDLESGCSGEPLSKRWDSDWWRLRKCIDASREADRRLGLVYEPGTFTGLWQGRMLIPSEQHFTALLTTRYYPPAFDEGFLGITTFPVFMRIQEHHSRPPDAAAPSSDDIATAYFPEKPCFSGYDARTITVRFGDNDASYPYSTHGAPGGPVHDADLCPDCLAKEDRLRKRREREAALVAEELFSRMGMGRSACATDERDGDANTVSQDPDCQPPCLGIQDIIFMGETDLRHGQAWNPFRFYGRVRSWDGMIGILRVSSDPRLGALLFYGYIVGEDKFVGNWRAAHQDATVPAYESAFMMARRDD